MARAETPGFASGVPARAHFEPLIPNPSSPHAEGRRAKVLLRRAREQVAASIGAASPEEVIFASSGTEAAQLAIRSILEPLLDAGRKPHWILGAGDHDAHHALCDWLVRRGGSVSLLPLDGEGAPEAGALSRLARAETALVSAVWVNNETGVITDVARLSGACQALGVPLHLDGAQAWGKLPVRLAQEGGLALASFSGHKIGALAGTGVLWRRGTASRPSGVLVGKQEGGWRGGTENLLGLVSLGAAASALDPEAYAGRLMPLRSRLEGAIRAAIPGTRIHGAGAGRVANTINLGFEGVEKDGLVAALDLAGYCVSAGAACSSGVTEPSRVLRAMGLDSGRARAAVRVSLCPGTEWGELDGFVAELARAVERARAAAG